MEQWPTTTLHNGVKMPLLGLGVMRNREGQQAMDEVVKTAADAGCRAFDNAAVYGNEKEFGIALAKTGLEREEVFITTKLRNSQQTYDDALRAFDLSLENLGMDYVDLYLVHWPVPSFGKYTQAWKALEQIYKQGRAKAIGVSNFLRHHLEAVFEMCEVRPMVNQIPVHPYYVDEALVEFCGENSIVITGYSPLGGGNYTQRLLNEPVIQTLSDKYGKQPAQIILRWSVQRGIVTIPGSTNPARVRANFDLFDFALSDEDIQRIAALNVGEHMMRDAPYDPDKMDNLF
jgi:diketogulonate reductase-like aldo/keto reductase